jgi:hypothetical protein
MRSREQIYATISIFLLLSCSVLSAQAVQNDGEKTELKPIFVEGVKPESITIERLQPGLSVVYYQKYFERDLSAISGPRAAQFQKKPGKPILELNHQFGTEEVFDSGTNRGVALTMTGYLYFQQAGTYQLQALSNDGVNMMIAGQTLISDPEQHSDRLSNIGHLSIEASGYYPTRIEYFQRKGTAALKLFWKKPGSSDFVPVPQNAYAHLP